LRSVIDTKLKGDIAVQSAVLEGLKREWGVLIPVGDRLSYDLVFELKGRFAKVQVKSAWYYEPDDVYLTDNRRTQTNRRFMKRSRYTNDEFDFALVYLGELQVFYVFPCDAFNAFASSISLVESNKRQRKPRSAEYREAWDLISQWAARKETSV